MNTQTHTQTEAVILEMLTENTGRSFLDSGDAYGRKWEKNQALGIDGLTQIPAVTWNGGSPTIQVFGYLKSLLTYAADFDQFFQKFDEERPNESWGANLEEWLDALGVKPEAESDFYSGRCSLNTYNFEYCLLSQTLQFTVFDIGGQDFVALQIHGGCDIRGGYTKPRIFRLDGFREDLIHGMESASVSCQNCGLGLDFQAGEIEAETCNIENPEHAEKIEALSGREIAEHFWNYETENTCPACGSLNTIAGA
jgi:hypothetical protein